MGSLINLPAEPSAVSPSMVYTRVYDLPHPALLQAQQPPYGGCFRSLSAPAGGGRCQGRRPRWREAVPSARQPRRGRALLGGRPASVSGDLTLGAAPRGEPSADPSGAMRPRGGLGPGPVWAQRVRQLEQRARVSPARGEAGRGRAEGGAGERG